MKNCLNIFGILTITIGFAFSANASEKKTVPKNVIFMVVDGMGPGQIEVGEIYMGGEKIRFREFPFQGEVTTHNVSKQVTDSAAAATAMATGYKVDNGVISEKRPGNGKELKTMLEYAKDLGKSTGLVTTTKFTDATPAAFGAHTASRSNKDDVLEDYFSKSYPNVIFGADEPSYRARAKKSRVPYQMATTLAQLENMVSQDKSKTCTGKDCGHYYGGFGSYPVLPGTISWLAIPLEASQNTFAEFDIPHLSDMAKSALALLSKNENGFFLMLESGLVDWIGHSNRNFTNASENTSAAYALGREFEEINRTLDVFLDFQKEHPDTLIVVTADHETGGLMIDKKNTKCLGEKKCLARINWTSPIKDEGGQQMASHTGVNVGIFAKGPGAEVFESKDASPMDNTDFPTKIFGPQFNN